MSEKRWFTAVGGLISYGPNFDEMSRQAGDYAGRVLGGDKPADLPVERADKFALIVNLKTAQALGLTLSPMFLYRADEVIK